MKEKRKKGEGGEEEEERKRGGAGEQEEWRRRGRLQAGLQPFAGLYLGHVSNRFCVAEKRPSKKKLTGVGVNVCV